MKAPSPPFQAELAGGAVICTERRQNDGQTLVVVRHEGDLLKLTPVDSDEELAWWFWTYVDEWGGFAS